ncbi:MULTISPECIES: TetR/AcrR family transcriptional regulator [Bacillus]|uniref:TetR/AcrR family transcriptional regulator n=2 Tax=Bacillus cereus group TaxID=86661 RepID=A0A2A7D9Q2_BACAN|nr:MULTISPECIES: TetR/AcrR family transcriptional regulator [Bacillus]MCP1163722.1 TetR/AcrR family transcriptional regulator [Bacillus sp. 1813sda1]MDC7972986.1 TetR/AcrR family transcriptional regulator [Bacillus sp. BLCC-B18]OTW72546.1 TetR family transcriptional regulator [Bacillus thuringiensis serovar coreanensis]OTX49602.1 TetR family transcriptional regulator [Bacillus thuringiensis serovar sooncheon]OTX57221.1 TetR family transcriptional regulator [Bacillus thuringiensis serovar guiya
MKKDWLEELITATNTDKRNERQMRILEAAVDMFGEKGYASTSTSEIAKRAGVAEGTIFRYYKTKKDLLLAVVMPTLTKFAAPFFVQAFAKEVFKSEYKSYEAFLRVVIHNRFEFAKKHFPMIKILIQEVPFQPELKNEIQHLVETELFSHFKKLIVKFQEDGEIIEMPPSSVLRLTLSAVLGLLLTRFLLLPEEKWNDEVEIENTIQFILYGVTPRN